MLNSAFTVQDPDLYDLIYSNKDYKTEFQWIRDCFLGLSLSSTHCLEVGAGSGKLTSCMRPLFTFYSIVEPSYHFYSRLRKAYSDDSNFLLFNFTLQDWLANQLLSTQSLSNISCILANFNVFNYMPMNIFIQALSQLYERTASQCCVIFDTWSLEFVSSQPESMSNRVSVPIPPSLREKFLGSTQIIRDSVSAFQRDANLLEIEFTFSTVSACSNYADSLGSERHTIYPYSIAKLIANLEQHTSWKLKLVQPYAQIKSTSSTEKHFCEYGSSRNWYFVICK